MLLPIREYRKDKYHLPKNVLWIVQIQNQDQFMICFKGKDLPAGIVSGSEELDFIPLTQKEIDALYVTMITDAPVQYDYDDTERLETLGVSKCNTTFRKVRCPRDHASEQSARYFSGSYLSCLEEKWNDLERLLLAKNV